MPTPGPSSNSRDSRLPLDSHVLFPDHPLPSGGGCHDPRSLVTLRVAPHYGEGAARLLPSLPSRPVPRAVVRLCCVRRGRHPRRSRRLCRPRLVKTRVFVSSREAAGESLCGRSRPVGRRPRGRKRNGRPSCDPRGRAAGVILRKKGQRARARTGHRGIAAVSTGRSGQDHVRDTSSGRSVRSSVGWASMSAARRVCAISWTRLRSRCRGGEAKLRSGAKAAFASRIVHAGDHGANRSRATPQVRDSPSRSWRAFRGRPLSESHQGRAARHCAGLRELRLRTSSPT